jgi:O-acetyl-ADP-ribose deacetylase (regulator of RNase III)
MGKGIAVEFKKRFGEISPQHVKKIFPQEFATLVGTSYAKQNGQRFVFNLVTKEHYYGKPTYGTLRSSLSRMKPQCDNLQITKVAMPKIGCGLDGLDWERVKKIIEEELANIDVTVNVL